MKKWMVCLLATSSFFSLSVPVFAWPTMEEVIYNQILKACQTLSHEEALNQVLGEYGEEAQNNYQMWQEITAEDCANATVPPDPSGIKGQCSSEFASTGEKIDTSNLTWRECWLEVTENKILFKTTFDTTAMVGNQNSKSQFIVTEQQYNFPEAMRDYWDEYEATGYCELSEKETICNFQLNQGQWFQIFKPDLNSDLQIYQLSDKPQNVLVQPL
ncbi:hypothetical protein VB834_22110 [Limnoraphis robusta Tam1]|uniref:DUF1311 domain-containing protein n=1 Tax=Limnoraphis robusta CCNP1315 TaxID=3110306 RepID=A0ABU5U777_9CYAN|nr:hypothetical protein [Limnoraphis robusta]MEA5497088.1 hypothetical protein [Limnoraphis robusta BA-68 BA1]MEA5523052.1 hypothetical protein [Limnoraphis robusta CCNP1315]MEA5541727.1 hypothetical protein [Limnoraphis robusta Tam1]MEA5548729.1 hypothetical protein [Limnoraphis robusta CCNP1324]